MSSIFEGQPPKTRSLFQPKQGKQGSFGFQVFDFVPLDFVVLFSVSKRYEGLDGWMMDGILRILRLLPAGGSAV